MTEQTARILNGLLGKLVIVLAIASAVILAPIIAAGIELLGKGQTMFECGMAGCEDSAEFEISGQWQLSGKIDTFLICESCADYMRRAINNPWKITLTKLNNNERELAK